MCLLFPRREIYECAFFNPDIVNLLLKATGGRDRRPNFGGQWFHEVESLGGMQTYLCSWLFSRSLFWLDT